jgi:hypothetical protein
MKFTIICDESSTNKKHLIVGALILPRVNHPLLMEELKQLKHSLNLKWEGEIKWSKISKRYLDKYKKIIEWFFSHLKANHFNFRAHVIDTHKKEYKKYGDGDREKSFYKIYFHLLLQSIKRLAIEEEGSNILILLDDKHNRYPFRLPVLKRILNSTIKRDLKLEKIVSNVEPRKSSGPRVEALIQIVDVLVGAIGYVRNKFFEKPNASEAKRQMVEYIEGLLGSRLQYDTSAKAPFNIWTFDVEVSLKKKRLYKKRNRPRA